MRNISKGPLELATRGALPGLALIATAMPFAAQAQVRARIPAATSPAQQTLRQRIPPQRTACPDPVEARQAGRSVPAGCPGAQEEQAPVAVEYREQSSDAPAAERREARPVTDRRIRTTVDTPLTEQPVNDGRLRRRIPGARVPADDAAQEAIPERAPPIRRRNDYVLRTPDEVAPRREVTPDRPPPIRRDGYVARTPDDVDTSEPTPVRPDPVRRRDNYVVATPDDAPRREYLPRRDGPVGADSARPVRPIRLVTHGNLEEIPGGLAGQIECILPNPRKTLTNLDVTTRMLCGFPGPGTPMTFRFKPAHWYGVEAAYAGGFAARITYGTPVDGVYPTIDVTEGSQARETAICVPLWARYAQTTSLNVGKAGDQKTTSRLWCTVDAKVVLPLDMGRFDNSMSSELFDAVIEDGPIEVGYFHISTPYTLDTVHQRDPYPGPNSRFSGTTAIQDRAKVAAHDSSMGNFYTYAEPPLTGPVLLCAEAADDLNDGKCMGYHKKVGNELPTVAFSVFASESVFAARSRSAKPGQTKSVVYSLMPGIIPVQHRAKAGGACRVVLGVQVDIKRIPGKVGIGYAEENRPRANPPGTTSGVANPTSDPVPPQTDSCY